MDLNKVWEGKNYILYSNHIEYRDDMSSSYKEYYYEDLALPDSTYIFSFPQFDICNWVMSFKGLIISFIAFIVLINYSTMFGILLLIGIGIIIYLGIEYRRIYFRIEFKDGTKIFDNIHEGNRHSFTEKSQLIQNTVSRFPKGRKEDNTQ